MSHNENFNAQIEQRILHMVKSGTITNSVVTTDNIQTCQISTYQGQEVHNDRPMYGNWGMTSVPPVNSQAITISGYGLNNNKFVIGTHDVNTHPKNLQEGEVQIYDTKGQTIYLENQTAIRISANNEVAIEIAGEDAVLIQSGCVTITSSAIIANGASGYFSDQNGKVITVQAGIITNIQ